MTPATDSSRPIYAARVRFMNIPCRTESMRCGLCDRVLIDGDDVFVVFASGEMAFLCAPECVRGEE